MMKLVHEKLETMDLVSPKVHKMKAMKDRPTVLPAESTKMKQVAYFTCGLIDTMFLETIKATNKRIKFAGFDIISPHKQIGY